MSFLPHTIPVHLIKKPYQQQGVALHVLRLDGVHPIISGNKWFKLKEYMGAAERAGQTTILTFGGAYSNHIIATAALAQARGFRSVGIIRGEAPQSPSPTLADAQQAGMHLFYLSRDRYKRKELPTEVWQIFDPAETTIIPEGGYGTAGVVGASSILQGLAMQPFTHIAAAVGTGTTLAGLVRASMPHQKVIGISALKNYVALENDINVLLPDEHKSRFSLLHDYHFGGYAKHNGTLIDFMNHWYSDTGIPTDFVYTGKLFYALHHLILNGFFPTGSQILAIHSGGLQGNRSLRKGTLIFMPN